MLLVPVALQADHVLPHEPVQDAVISIVVEQLQHYEVTIPMAGC